MKKIGKVKIELEGLNVEKFLNIIIQSNIKIYKVNRPKFNCFFVVIDVENQKNFLLEAKKYGYSANVVEFFGVYKVVNFVKNRFVFIVSSILMLSIYLFSNIFLWRINISGNDFIQTSDILETLRDNGIFVGNAKSSFNISQVEKILRENFDDIGLVSAEMYGNALNININEKLTKNYSNYLPILSEYNGVVREFELVSGSSCVKVGDIVEVGQTLVEPYIVDGSGNRKNIIAKANLVIEVDFNFTIEYNGYREVLVDTGNVSICYNYSLWGLNFRDNNICKFKNYRLDKKTDFIFDNFFIPLKKTKYVFYEQEKILESVPFEDCKDELVKRANIGLEETSKGHKLFNKTDNIVSANNIFYITAAAKSIVKFGDKYDNNN